MPGAFVLGDRRPLPAAIEEFLAAGPPPVYVGFGSMPDTRAEATSALVLAAARVADVRLVLGAGWARLKAAADDVLTVDDVAHGVLFPRLAAIVHHGGAGTAHAAARAGVPQIVVPHGFDQFDWGRRIEQLGSGTFSRCALPVPLEIGSCPRFTPIPVLDGLLVRRYLTSVKTTVSSKGQIVLPAEIRRLDHIEPGQEFEVERVERGEYRLVRRAPRPNEGLVDWLLACPEKGFFTPVESESTDSL